MINKSFETIVDSFAEFFKSNEGDLPNISFTKFSDLNRFVQELSGINVTINNNDSYEEIIDNISKGIIETGLSPENKQIMNDLNNISMSFASNIESAFSTITKVVDPIVSDLKEKIKDQYVFNIKKEGAENLLNDEKDNKPLLDDFVILKWENLNSQMLVNDIINTACANANISKEDLNKFNLDIIIQKLSFAKDFKDNQISKEAKDKVLDVLIKKYSNDSTEINDSVLNIFFDALTSLKAYTSLCKDIQKKMKDTSRTVTNCIEFISFFTNFDVFIKALKNGRIDLSDMLNQNVIDNILSNTDVVSKTLYAMKYYCLYQKNVFYKDKLILSNRVINDDEYQKYISKGNTLEDIYNYLKAMYPSGIIPIKGISTSSVLNTDITEKLIKANKAKEFKETYIKVNALNKAFSLVCTNYIKDILDSEEKDNEDHLSDKFIHELKESVEKINRFSSRLQGRIENLDDVLYEFIIHLNYEDTLIYTLYKNLGKEYIDLAKAKEDIDSSDIFAANAKVTSDLILNFMFNKLCK